MSHAHHHSLFVVLSVVIAVLGSWTALDLNLRVRAHVGRALTLWLAATALAMGLSIWSMHFVAMLGFDAGFPVRYDIVLTVVSLILAVGSTALAFVAVHVERPGRIRVALAALFMGGGICLMHYVGMAAIRAAYISYDGRLVALSFVIAVAASWAALVTALSDQKLLQRALAALVLGFAICAMHYTAMAASSLAPIANASPHTAIDRLTLAFGIASSTMLLLFLALTSATFDRRFEAQALREARLVSERESYLRTVLGELPVGVFVIDGATLRVEFANQEANRLAGTEVQGQRMPDPTMLEGRHPDGRHFAEGEHPVMRTLATGSAVERTEVLCRRADGSQFHAEVSTTPVPIKVGPPKVVLAMTDVTARVVAEESLMQAQKLGAIGQLTGGVAHDFNNLLTIIRSSVDLLRRPEVSDEKRRRYMDAISDTADRAAKLTGQLLAFARRQALRPETFEVRERLTSILEMVRTVVGSRVGVAIEASSAQSFVSADPNQFETAIVNMVLNARDAMNGEGKITFSIHEAPPPEPSSDPAPPTSRFVGISIRDTGSGMTAEQLPHIFEPFYTTKEVGQGTGLGLSQVYGFAKQSGGEIQVESMPGKGTIFTLSLPRADLAPSETQRPNLPEQVGRAVERKTVLVVEDNIQIGEFATQLLDDLGYAAVWADSAQAALAVIEESHSPFDIVFTDVVMPGMSGIELAKTLKTRAPHLPVLLTSGYSHVLAQDGTHGFPLLQKPYSARSLLEALRRALATT